MFTHFDVCIADQYWKINAVLRANMAGKYLQ